MLRKEKNGIIPNAQLELQRQKQSGRQKWDKDQG